MAGSPFVYVLRLKNVGVHVEKKPASCALHFTGVPIAKYGAITVTEFTITVWKAKCPARCVMQGKAGKSGFKFSGRSVAMIFCRKHALQAWLNSCHQRQLAGCLNLKACRECPCEVKRRWGRQD